MGGSSKKSARTSARKSAGGRPVESDGDENGGHAVAEEQGGAAHAPDESASDSNLPEEHATGILSPISPGENALLAQEDRPSKRKRREAFSSENLDDAVKKANPASEFKLEGVDQIGSSISGPSDLANNFSDGKIPLEISTATETASQQTRDQNLSNVQENRHLNTKDLQPNGLNMCPQTSTESEPQSSRLEAKTNQSLNDLQYNVQKYQEQPEYRSTKAGCQNDASVIESQGHRLIVSSTDVDQYMKVDEPTVSDKDASANANEKSIGTTRQDVSDRAQNDAKDAKQSVQISGPQPAKSDKEKITTDKDPSITSTTSGLAGSIKTFAVVGPEPNIPVPDSVNAASKIRAMSSCSIGESSQKLSWLEAEERSTVEVKARNDSEFSELNLNETNTSTPSEGIELSFHEPKSHKQSPSVDQLKMALLLEASIVHRSAGAGADRAFAEYWESLERFITLGSTAEVNRSTFEINDTLSSFLTTKRLKRLHNKLILAIMFGAIGVEVQTSRIMRHLPNAWKAKTSKQTSVSTSESKIIDIDSQQWHELLGKDSGAWTIYGNEMTRIQSHYDYKEKATCDSSEGLSSAGNDIIPSGRIPASLHLDPIVRKRASKTGMRVSENAIWMMVVAVQKYMETMIQKTIAIAAEVNSSYVSEIPKTNTISVFCSPQKQSKSPTTANGLHRNASEGRSRLIGANELSVMLASEPLIAGRAAASRMASMRSSVRSGNVVESETFVRINDLINSSIQRSGIIEKGVDKKGSQDTGAYPFLASLPPLQQRKKQDNDAAPSVNISDHMNQKLQQVDTASSPAASPLEPLSTDVLPYRPIAKAHFHPVGSVPLSTHPSKQNSSLSTSDIGLTLAASIFDSKERNYDEKEELKLSTPQT